MDFALGTARKLPRSDERLLVIALELLLAITTHPDALLPIKQQIYDDDTITADVLRQWLTTANISLHAGNPRRPGHFTALTATAARGDFAAFTQYQLATCP